MSFTWEPLDKVTASSYSEMKNAVNSLTDSKLAPRFNWQESEPTAGMLIEAARYSELQSASDYADDKNVCNSDNAANYTTKDVTQNSVDDSTQDVTQDAVDYNTDYSNQDNGYDATLHSTVDSSNYTSEFATEDTGYDATLYSTVDSSKDDTYHATADNGYDADLHTAVDSDQHNSYDTAQDIGYDATFYEAVDNDQHGTYNANVDLGYDATEYITVDNDQHAVHNVTADVGYDATEYATVDTDQHGTYDATADSGYDSTLNVTVDNDQHGTYNSTQDVGYDSALYATNYSAYNASIDTSRDVTYNGAFDSSFNHSCFTGASLTINEMGQYVRVDNIKAGDYLMGANGKTNMVIGIEKVLVGSRDLYRLNNTDALFTGEHPFLLPDGTWGSFDKKAMDRELTPDNITLITTKSGLFRVIGDMESYSDKTVKQLKNGDMGLDINGDSLPLTATLTDLHERFVYTVMMDGDRTWNIEGIVISGLALTGENPTLEEYLD